MGGCPSADRGRSSVYEGRMSQMRVWANADRSRGVPFAKTFIRRIGNDSPLASRVCDRGGSTAWDELCPVRNTPYLVSIEALGFAPFSERFENIFQDLDITLTRSAPILQSIHADAWDIKTEDGRRYIHRLATT